MPFDGEELSIDDGLILLGKIDNTGLSPKISPKIQDYLDPKRIKHNNENIML